LLAAGLRKNYSTDFSRKIRWRGYT